MAAVVSTGQTQSDPSSRVFRVGMMAPGTLATVGLVLFPLAIVLILAVRHNDGSLLGAGFTLENFATALGDLPLALEQAAAWRAETGMPADEYLRLLEEKQVDLLGLAPPLDYQLPVIAAWNVSLDQLETRNPAAMQLLQLCAFCAPESISPTPKPSAR